MSLKDHLPVRWSGMRPVTRSAEIERSLPQWYMDMWQFTYNNHTYSGSTSVTQTGRRQEEVAANFAGYVQAAYRRNGVVAACLLARESLFSEARFQWRQFRQGRPGSLFGTDELAVIEQPWPNGTTGDLLVRMEQDSSIEGNFFGRRVGSELYRLRPDWVSIVLGSNVDEDDPSFQWDARPIGYAYHPGGYNSGYDPVLMRIEEVIHYAPRLDPTSVARGISLFESVLREIYADGAATDEKLRFFEDSGTPRTVAIVPIPDPQDFLRFVDDVRTRSQQMGRFEHLWLQQGVEFKTIGTTLEQQEFVAVQAAGESRIAAALGVPAVVAGLKEGMEASTYADFDHGMRRFADLTMRPLWRKAAAALQSILVNPGGAELWYDDRDIPALKDDIVKRAEVWTKNAAAAKLLIDAGYVPDSVTGAIDADDWARLEHTGLPTVQVQQAPQAALPPGSQNGDQSENEEDGATVAERAAEILGGVKT